MNDIQLLEHLATKMETRLSRITRPRLIGKLASWGGKYFDPAAVAHRYLRRFAGGEWHRGEKHCTRLNFGPGLGFPSYARKRNPAPRVILLFIGPTA